jgi:hypothetical protein
MHKFHLGQMVAYNPQKGTWAARGAYVVTAKLPQRDGEFEYHIRHAGEQHERMARESELQAMSEIDAQPIGNRSNRKAK